MHPVAKTVIAKDLIRDIENGQGTKRHPTLIQLSASSLDDSVDLIGKRLVDELTGMVKGSADLGKEGDIELQRAYIEPLRRYVSAHLTRSEIEQLRNHGSDLHIEQGACMKMRIFIEVRARAKIS